MSALRVLFVTGEYPPAAGGVGDYTANLRLALAGAGVRSLVLTSNTDPASTRDIHTVDRWRWGIAGRVQTIVERERIDLVHIQYQAGAFGMHPAVNLLPWSLRRSIGVPVVTTFHDLRPPYLFPRAGNLRKLAILRMARASSAVVVTNFSDERALARAGIRVERIPIGPNLPPPSVSGEAALRTVAFFGFPARSKGIEDLIQSVGMIEVGRRPDLLLVGSLGEPSDNNDLIAEAAIDRLAREQGVTVWKTGFLPAKEASDRLASTGINALPFRGGASQRSGSLLAALQAGRPVVTTVPARGVMLGPIQELPQLVLVIPDDPEALRDAILGALSDPPAAAPLPNEYRWRSIGSQHQALYDRLLARSR